MFDDTVSIDNKKKMNDDHRRRNSLRRKDMTVMTVDPGVLAMKTTVGEPAHRGRRFV
jgi:hypothetical protein